MQKQTLKSLYLIRHGETEPNKNKIIQGSWLDSPVNSTGIRQSALFFEHYRDVPFDHVYTSALIRTSESVGGFIGSGVPHTILPNLNEISWGCKDGTRIDATEQNEYDAMILRWKSGDLDVGFDGGESPNQVAIRLKKAMAFIMERSQEKIILVCMHGRAMRILLSLLLEKPVSEMEQFLHSNQCLYKLEWDGFAWHILLSNDITHLETFESKLS